MIAIAVTNNGTQPVFDYDQLLEMLERDYQLDKQDVASLIKEAIYHHDRHPELEAACETAIEEMNNDIKQYQDGVWGDSWLMAKEELQSCWEDIEAEIDALESTSRKNNTKADIARRLRNVVANLQDVL